MLPSLDGRSFRSPAEVAGGDVGPGTAFDYYEEDGGRVYARFAGGEVELGFLIGTRHEDELDFRYSQLRRDATTAGGHCHSIIQRLEDGRLRLCESWIWESAIGSGTSVLDEI